MKPFLTGLAIATPTVAVILYFSLQAREDVKQDQAEARIEQKIEATKFDQDFAAAWNGKPLQTPAADNLVALERERQELKEKRQRLDRDAGQDYADLKAALEAAGGEGRKP